MIELNGIQLDKTSAVPLYEQLRKALLEAITSGKLSAGTKLPTEEELCASSTFRALLHGRLTIC